MSKYLIPSLNESTIPNNLIWTAQIVVLGLGCLVARVVYLLYFHPLASFPGPRKAALSTWWIYRLSQTGRTEQVLEKLHEKYNTQALRIGPNELHLTDPKQYHTIYSQRYIFPKDPSFYKGFVVPGSVFTETDGERHRQRKKLMSAFFSKASIRNLQGVIIDKVSLLCHRMSREKSKGPIRMYQAARCLTIDVISELALGSCFNALSDATDTSYQTEFLHAFDLAAVSIWAMIYIPFMSTIVRLVPPTMTSMISRAASQFQALLAATHATVSKFKTLRASGKQTEHEVIFERLMGLPDTDMKSEASVTLLAGSDTTATTLAKGLDQISRQPHIYARLVQELSEAGINHQDDYDLLRLEQLPYLSAVVKESLRYTLAASARLPRIVPPGIEPLVVDGRPIPTGTTVGMSAYSMHFNKDIWGPEAWDFLPERWLTDDAKHLDKYMVAFSKGARQCLGINLAQAELTLALAMLVNRFSFTLDETMVEEDTFPLDYFVVTYKGSGVRLHVHEKSGE